jgi:hypothetical protein
MSRDTAPSPDTAVPEVPTMTDLHAAVIFERSQFRGMQPFSEKCLDEIATLVRSLSSGRGVYVPREAISDVMLRLRYLANRIYGQQVANDEFASIIADLAALTPPTGDRK